MRTPAINLPLTALLLIAVPAAAGEPKPAFTDPAQAGPDFSVQGEYAGVKVTIKRADGKTIDVPLSRLSEADREYVRRAVFTRTITGKVV